jgi:exonuclease I
MEPIGERVLIIKPEPGIVIESKAASIHGITNERAHDEGFDIRFAFAEFEHACAAVQAGAASLGAEGLHVAYNLPFDDLIMTSAAMRLWQEPDEALARSRIFAHTMGMCAMKATTAYLRIPHDSGGYRAVKLAQAYRRITGLKMQGAHDALDDVKATLTVFKAILETTPI